jgi:hypothetical protein
MRQRQVTGNTRLGRGRYVGCMNQEYQVYHEAPVVCARGQSLLEVGRVPLLIIDDILEHGGWADDYREVTGPN